MNKEGLDKIIKCLNLLESNQDGEVLNAARMANKLLKQDKKTWESIFKLDTLSKMEKQVDNIQQELHNIRMLGMLYKSKYTNIEEEFSKYKKRGLIKRIFKT